MNRSVDAGLADQKIMIDHGDMIFGQLNVCPMLGSQDMDSGWMAYQTKSQSAGEDRVILHRSNHLHVRSPQVGSGDKRLDQVKMPEPNKI